jgi:hypothetical protein
MAMHRWAAACLVLCVVGCGTSHPSRSEQRATARAFAEEVVAGHGDAARSYVAKGAAPAVREQAARLSAAFAHTPGHLVGEPRRSGTAQWAFAYTKRVNGKKGAFSRERGILVVDTGSDAPGVTFAAILGRQIAYSTHHDSELLPSKR